MRKFYSLEFRKAVLQWDAQKNIKLIDAAYLWAEMIPPKKSKYENLPQKVIKKLSFFLKALTTDKNSSKNKNNTNSARVCVSEKGGMISKKRIRQPYIHPKPELPYVRLSPSLMKKIDELKRSSSLARPPEEYEDGVEDLKQNFFVEMRADEFEEEPLMKEDYGEVLVSRSALKAFLQEKGKSPFFLFKDFENLEREVIEIEEKRNEPHLVPHIENLIASYSNGQKTSGAEKKVKKNRQPKVKKTGPKSKNPGAKVIIDEQTRLTRVVKQIKEAIKSVEGLKINGTHQLVTWIIKKDFPEVKTILPTLPGDFRRNYAEIIKKLILKKPPQPNEISLGLLAEKYSVSTRSIQRWRKPAS